jgi:phosphoglycolate phosphatase
VLHQKWRGILFDLDGTLVDTATEVTRAVNDTLRSFELPEVCEAQVKSWFGRGMRPLLLKALAEVSPFSESDLDGGHLLVDALERYERHYQAHCASACKLYPGVKSTLKTLKTSGFRLAVVTNKKSHSVRKILNAMGIANYFEIVVGGDSFPVKKPDPTSVRDCMYQFEIGPEETLYVGDSALDAATARNADMSVWLVSYGYNQGESVESCYPDHVMRNFNELSECLSLTS